ncbi:PhzF family phenazine biosynthesis protein [Microbacterium horticulturae]|uniref:PhzF family phenazine biosynthesis protein n=1 Tax=Microbacterium horticulturae TaxID=3028316 RepID=A0ABY8BZX8_9MICO|nr:PhzF family phenazine biosynthesis protein [Microbacterium sp. KACC 23027]WEG09749.1 PhzF family phenazine biosynthesis protein [Microbacterium sp. KACC 23027]
MTLRFSQVDVFSSEPLRGNPVAVVHDADGLTDEQMQAFARWTNLSETTFLLRPSNADADYRLRIFTPGGELPFAGHPTLGSAHAWLEAGSTPRGERTENDRIVQECGTGLVELRERNGRLAFAAPPLRESAAPEPGELDRVAEALRIPRDSILSARRLDNGPAFLAVRLRDARQVLEVTPDLSAIAALPRPDVGIVGAQPAATGPDTTAIEVRVFCPNIGVPEDPITGSFNAALAQWLTADGILPPSYVAAQGTALGRRGRVHITTEADTIWVGGDTTTTIRGTVEI